MLLLTLVFAAGGALAFLDEPAEVPKAVCEGLCEQTDIKQCPDGTVLYREPLLGCEFPECPICPASACCFGGSYTNGEDTITKQVCDCTAATQDFCPYKCASFQIVSELCACKDLDPEVVEELNNSFCDAVIGVGLVNGVCQELSGCSKPEGVALYNTLAECQQLCEPFACPAIVKACPCGSGYATPLPGDPFCTFPDCPEYAVKSYMCSEPGNKCSCDYTGIDTPFGFCEAIVGVGIRDGQCVGISGCPLDANSPLDMVFDNMDECNKACFPPTDEICPPMKNGQPNYTCFVAPCQFATCDRFPDEDVECVDCYTLPIEQACAPIFVLDGEKIDCKCGCADLNDDGSSNIQDVILLVKYVISNGNPTDVTVSDCGFAEANLNDDDDADVLDIITLINILIGKLPHPCGWEL